MNTDHCADCGVSGVFIAVHPTAIWLEFLEDFTASKFFLSGKMERKGEKGVMAGNREEGKSSFPPNPDQETGK